MPTPRGDPVYEARHTTASTNPQDTGLRWGPEGLAASPWSLGPLRPGDRRGPGAELQGWAGRWGRWRGLGSGEGRRGHAWALSFPWSVCLKLLGRLSAEGPSSQRREGMADP